MVNNLKNKKVEKHFVRIMGTDIDGEKNLLYGLAKIKGVNIMMANAVCKKLKLKTDKKVKELDDKEIETIEKFLEEPKGLPSWLLNFRKNLFDSKDRHLVTKDLDFNLMQVKRRLFKIKCYRGIRLKEGLPVRGQRTKSNFRKKKLNKRR